MTTPNGGASTNQVLKRHCNAVFRELPKALAGAEEPLHQMRVAGRRLRVALPFLTQKPRGKKVRRALTLLRELVREAGASRDLDVATALLEARLKDSKSPNPVLKTILKRLKATRNRSRSLMAEALLDLDLSGLRRRLRACVAGRGEGLFTTLQRLRQERQVRGEALLESFKTLGDRYDPDALHELRIGCRRLRYALEVSDALKGIDSGTPTLLKEIQGQLGRIHDDHVVAQWLTTLAARAGKRGDVPEEIEASRQEAFFLESGRRRHREFLASDPQGRIRASLGLAGGVSGLLQPFLGAPRLDR